MEFRDQVLERIFRKWEAMIEQEEHSSSEDSDSGIKMELRQRYLL